MYVVFHLLFYAAVHAVVRVSEVQVVKSQKLDNSRTNKYQGASDKCEGKASYNCQV